MIRKQFLDLDKWDDLLSIGYTFGFDSTEVHKHIQYRNDPKRTIIKAGSLLLRKSSADAYLSENIREVDDEAYIFTYEI
jgi:hypothetical protein